MIGGSAGQMIQLNIRGVGDPQISTPRCQATLSFRDTRNAPVGDSRAVDLGPGQSATLTLNFNQLVSRVGERFELEPLVTPASGGVNFACQASVEVYEPISGRTTAWAPSANPGFSDPDDDVPPVSGALGQTMRLGVVRTISDPDDKRCIVDLMFRNSQSIIVAQKRVLLEPGHGDALDLNMNTQVSRLGDRALIAPSLRTVATGSGNGCLVSVQVFDQRTGWTTTYVEDPNQ
jgi:hypothetical protein